MKFTELADKNVDELKSLLKEKKLSLFECRLKLKTMQLRNPNEIKALRADIARINTALRAKEA